MKLNKKAEKGNTWTHGAWTKTGRTTIVLAQNCNVLGFKR